MNEKIIEYDIVWSYTNGGLVEVTNEFIKKGWQPFGAPYFTGNFFNQAIVKYVEKPTAIVNIDANKRSDFEAIKRKIEQP